MPAVAAELYAPLLRMIPLGREMPERFESGDRLRVAIRFFGMVPAGTQLIAIEDLARPSASGSVGTMRDAGRPLTGPLALLNGWNHEMTFRSTSQGAAIWHDELTIRGAATPLLAPVLWVMWRWRGAKLRRLSRNWDRRTGLQGT